MDKKLEITVKKAVRVVAKSAYVIGYKAALSFLDEMADKLKEQICKTKTI